MSKKEHIATVTYTKSGGGFAIVTHYTGDLVTVSSTGLTIDETTKLIEARAGEVDGFKRVFG